VARTIGFATTLRITVRRLAAALLLAPALLLTGCGSSAKPASADASGASPCPSGSAAAAPMTVPAPVSDDSALPAVSGDFGKGAKITPAKGTPDGKFVVKTLSEGSGQVVGKQDFVGFNLVADTWGGRNWQNSYADGGPAALVDQSQTQMMPMFADAVQGHKVGSRVLVVAPPAAGFQNAGYSKYNITCHDTNVLVVDITMALAHDAQASGTAQTVAADLPKVTMGDKAAAKFTITDAERNPKKLGVGVLIKGHGPVVKPGQQLFAQYTGALLKDGSVFDSSWSHGGATQFQIGAGKVIPGWDKGLVGQTVGSRVVLSIPSADAYGAQGNQGIPANSNLVFVVDILGAA
jgi:peptidylprolyl isomerase